MQDNLTFEEALKALKIGGSVYRAGWNGKDLFLTLQLHDAESKMTKPYIYMSIPIDGTDYDRVPWVASQSDLLSNDWKIFE